MFTLILLCRWYEYTGTHIGFRCVVVVVIAGQLTHNGCFHIHVLLVHVNPVWLQFGCQLSGVSHNQPPLPRSSCVELLELKGYASVLVLVRTPLVDDGTGANAVRMYQLLQLQWRRPARWTV